MVKFVFFTCAASFMGMAVLGSMVATPLSVTFICIGVIGAAVCGLLASVVD